MIDLYTKVAGVTYPNADGESRQDILSKLTGNEPCRLVPEPENPYDKNAIAVHISIAPGQVKHVGYVPRKLAEKVAPFLQGEALMVEIAEVTGGFDTRDGDIANYGLVIHINVPDADRAELWKAPDMIDPAMHTNDTGEPAAYQWDNPAYDGYKSDNAPGITPDTDPDDTLDSNQHETDKFLWSERPDSMI